MAAMHSAYPGHAPSRCVRPQLAEKPLLAERLGAGPCEGGGLPSSGATRAATAASSRARSVGERAGMTDREK